MDRETYLTREHWFGSYYELAMEYAPRGDDERLLKAIAALWETPALRGPWREVAHFGQAPTPVATVEADGSNWLHGVLLLPAHRAVGCLSLTVREEQGSDWLDFCLPTGMLELVFPVRYPLTREDNPWLEAIDRHLLAIAEQVYQASPFDLALIGEEASGQLGIRELTAAGLAKGGVLAPPTLSHKLGMGSAAMTRPSGLHWFPWRGV